jgi:hypothetical protein
VFVAEHPALDTPLRLPLGDNDGADISLECPFSKPGPADPLRLAVVLSGSERALVRVSAWVTGLKLLLKRLQQVGVLFIWFDVRFTRRHFRARST